MNSLSGIFALIYTLLFYAWKRLIDPSSKFIASNTSLEISDSIKSKSYSSFVQSTLGRKIPVVHIKLGWLSISTGRRTRNGLKYLLPAEANKTWIPRSATCILTSSDAPSNPVCLTVKQTPLVVLCGMETDRVNIQLPGVLKM